MARFTTIILSLIVLMSSGVAATRPVEGASLKDQIGSARQQKDSLAKSIGRQEALLDDLERDQRTTQSALRDTTRQLDGINVDQDSVKRRLEQAKAALDRAERRHESLVDDLRQTDFTLGLLEQELANGEKDLQSRREALGRRLVEAYRTENTSLLEQVFTADSFSDVLTRTSAYLSYGDQDVELSSRIVADQLALDNLRLMTTSTRLQTDQTRRETIALQAKILARKDELDEAKRRLKKLEQKTKRIQKRQQARYRELVKNEKQAKLIRARQVAAKRALERRISGLVRKAQARAARRSPGLPGGGSGRFIWPTRGTVTQNYGCTGVGLSPRRGSCPSFHDGIDIANAAGTPIRAAGDGVVAFVGYRPDGAFVVVIGHAGGYETVYAHMQARYPVKAGQYVKRGAIIGYMGSTGYSTGNHLHWEVSRGFQTLNPRAFV